MSRSYIKAIHETLPNIDIVFDRFHVMKLMNEAVDEVRKGVYRDLGQRARKELKNSRFLVLRNGTSLLPDEEKRLQRVIKRFEPIGLAYLLKEDLRGIWNLLDEATARTEFIEWSLDVISLVTGSWDYRLEPLHKFAMTLMAHLDGILAFWRHRISNGRAEGLNNKIKTLKRQAYGFRDNEYFKLRLYHLHAQKNQLAG